jgi:maltose alpha-D-glucosyltransferase/alpha-amylase
MAPPSGIEAGLDLAQLERLVAAIPVELLAGQRWFRAKQRRITDLRLDDAAPLVPDPEAVGFDAALVAVRVSYADDGPDDRYLLPLVLEPRASEATLAGGRGSVSVRDAQTGAVLREPRDGEGIWRRLVAAMAAGLSLPSVHGAFGCEATEALATLVPSPLEAARVLDERRLRVEQTNTSVVLGERLIYKAYRLLEPGQNPDLEISAFLTEVGFEHTPALAGSIRYLPEEGEPCVAGMLQAYVPAQGDAWDWLLGELGRADARSGALDGVRQIGAISAGLHAALASRPHDPAFPARPATAAEKGAWRDGAERQLAQAEAALRGAEQARLTRLAPTIRARFADAFGSPASAAVSRIHGDYHLGQLLRLRDGFAVIDFEGEPARPLTERRAPQPPLKDVAGMIRSFDYAARTVAAKGSMDAAAAGAWLASARETFLDAYRAGGVQVDLDSALLAAFELEKACYEVRYEANNRPDWLWLPLAAIERLVA